MKRLTIGKRVAALILTATMAFTLAGCSNTATSENNSSETNGVAVGGVEDAFHVAIGSDPASLDPTQCNDYGTELVVNNLYDTLLKFSADGTELEPCLAESWEKVDDLTYVYQIRQGVKFWDGKDMTAEDVVFSLNRHMNPDMASLFAYMFAPVESIAATGDYEVTVKLSTPDTSFMYVVATMAGSVEEKAFVEANADNFGKSSVGTMATGPYKFDSWKEGSQLIFSKNESYWNTETEFVNDTLEFDIIEDAASSALAMTSGQIQFMNTPSNDTLDQLTDSGIVDVEFEDGLQNGFVYFNCSTGPFADPNVRKAAACAIDAASISKASKGEGHYKDAGALDVDPEVMGYYTEDWVALQNELDSYEYDVEKAKEYLANSAYPDGFECTMPTCTMMQKESEAVQYYLGQIGITVNLETHSFNDYCLYVYGVNLNSEGLRDYDLLPFAWFPDYSDPIALLKLYYGPNATIGGSNMAAYMNKDFDALLDLSATQDGEERSETMMNAYRMLNADCPGKMLNYFGPSYAIGSDYEVTMSPMWMWNFDFTQVKAK